jgi:hypothetical protein
LNHLNFKILTNDQISSEYTEKSEMIEKTDFIMYFGSTNESIEGIFKIVNMNLNDENIQIGKTENDDFYYLNLMNKKCRDKLIISTTMAVKNFASLNKQQIKMFHLNREYSKFIEHIFKHSEFQNKPRNFIDNIILKLFLNYKIYVKLRNLTNSFQS